MSDERAECGGQQDGFQHGSLTLGTRGTLQEVTDDAALVVAAVGVSGRVMVVRYVAAAGLYIVLHTDEAVGMVVMGKDRHRQHDDAD